MKPQHALPLLSAAASFMVLGLVLGGADAQPPSESPTVQVRPTARVRPRLGDATRSGGDEAAETPAAPGTSGGGLPEFETGVEYEPVSPRARVTFNLEDADLPDLVRLISNLTGKRFILSSKVRSLKATVFAPTQVTVAEAYNAFLSILEVNGMTVVPAGRYLKISETANIENQPIPLYTGDSPTPGSDRFITRLHRVENVSAEDAATLLSRFKSQAGAVTAYAPTNTLILTDTGTQIQRMLRLIEAVDVSRTGEQIWIEPIHYANAAEIAAKLQEIFPSAQGSSGGGAAASPAAAPRAPRRARATANAAATPTAAGQQGSATIGSRTGESRITSILSDERTNSLIILATERAYLRILEMIRHLDVPMEGEGRIHVHYIQNGDAEEVASTLQSLIGGGGAAARPGGGAAGAAGARRPAAAPAAAPAAGGELAGMFEGEIRVTTHTPTNALVITSSLHDYAALRRVIERLDRPRRQVFIEAVVMDMTVTRASSLGFSFHGGVPNPAGDGSLSIFGFDAATSLGFPLDQSLLSGMAVGVRGAEIEDVNLSIPGSSTGLSIPGFGVVMQAIASSGDANILSTPHIIAMDNVQAEINIGQNVPLQTSGIAPGALGGGLGGLAGLAGLAGGAQGASGLGALAGGVGGGFGVPRQDVGTIIRITPHINEHDEIRMELEEEISDVGAAQGDLGVVPINRRTAKTEVMVRDQQTVVIGGLMRDTVTTSETKIPILGDIPLLGALFRSTTRQTTKSNLLLFLTPYIIRDMSDLRAIYERKMRERQEFLDRYFVFGDHDYEPPIDYSRTRGLVAEIIGELRELDEEMALEAALEAEPPPEHVARAPIGIYDGPSEDGEGGDVVITPDGDVIEPPPEPQISETPNVTVESSEE
ncbi:MAG: type II secretion system secretin GspD [Sandaracinus sp.]|nr:type II secretion system secretin GspD [Sandaracinus sp.]